jgi:tRNA(Ile)-lysidine synthase
MLPLAERVYRTIQRHSLIPLGARVVAAASGGADSTALVLLLAELAPRAGFVIASLAHYNHRLRGAAADADQDACARLAARLGCPFDSTEGDVTAAARRLGTSVEDAGRRLRYEFFEEVAARRQADCVAVGHTRDDQAETVLLNLLRGGGARARAGMAARRGRVVRPLIECRHDELVAWLGERGETFQEDESNRDRRYLRNRVRLDLLPFLRERFSPSVVEVLARNAELASAEAEFLDAAAATLAGEVVRERGKELLLDARRLAESPPVLAARVARDAIRRLAGGRAVSLDHAQAVVALAAGPQGRRRNLPGQAAVRRGGWVELCGRVSGRHRDQEESQAVGIPGANSFVQKLSIPGEVLLPGPSRVVLTAELRPLRSAPGEHPFEIPRDRVTAAVDAATAQDLIVRTRRPGDRLTPLGAGGRRKLQDYFVDRKVPRDLRDRVPLVVSGDGRIVWVAGHGIGDEFRVREGTSAVVILRLRGEIA